MKIDEPKHTCEGGYKHKIANCVVQLQGVQCPYERWPEELEK